MNKAGIANRLSKAGLRDAAESLREEIRLRRKGAGEDRDSASQAAWAEMWDTFRPVVERWEKGQFKETETPLTGCPIDVDPFLDPDYTEKDPGKWLRDGLIWTAAEIRRVVIDSDEGTRIDLARARTKPPTAWAVFCLESFARKPPAKRGELIARVLPFATRSHETAPIETDSNDVDGFLGDIT